MSKLRTLQRALAFTILAVVISLTGTVSADSALIAVGKVKDGNFVPQRFFRPEDETVIILVFLPDLPRKVHRMELATVRPDGSRLENLTLDYDFSDVQYTESGSAPWQWSYRFDEDKLAEHPGLWQATTFVDGEKVGTANFVVVSSPSDKSRFHAAFQSLLSPKLRSNTGRVSVRFDNSGNLIVSVVSLPSVWDDVDSLRKAAQDLVRIMPDILEFPNVACIEVIHQGLFTDPFGHQSIEEAVTLHMHRRTANRVNWSYYETTVVSEYARLFQVADYYRIHGGVYQGLTPQLKAILRPSGGTGTRCL